MKLFTSYYAAVRSPRSKVLGDSQGSYAMRRNFLDQSKCVSISLDCGRTAKYEGRCYAKLAPTRELLNHWHTHKDEGYYVKTFRAEVLNKLDAHVVANELGDGAILLCYEKLGDFCHRHLVAEWFRANGIDCEEWCK